MSTRISLDRVVTLGVPVAWHEAVAVAHQIAQAVQAGSTATHDELLDFAQEHAPNVRETVPAGQGLDTCLISVTGDVDVTGNSRAPFSADAASSVLRALLDERQAPRELVSLVRRHEQEPSASGFVDDLKFFMRPDGPAAIGALAARAIAADAEAAQLEEFERLRQGAAGTPTVKDKLKPSLAPRSRRVLVLAVAVAAVIALGGALTMRGNVIALLTAAAPSSSAGNETADAPAAASTPVQQIAGRIDALLDKGLARLGLAAAEPSAAAPEPEKPVARAAKRASAPRTPAEVPTTPIVLVMPPAAAEPSPGVPDPAFTTTDEPDLLSDVIFDGDGAGVEPPVLRWPQLPNEPGDGLEPGTPYLELLINETGTVDKVRLRAARSSFHDRMLVSAAKAWSFHPALKDGRPVKYLIKVPIVTP